MANTAPVLIWMSGIDKQCTFFNQVWLNFTGRPLAAELGYGWSEGVHRDDLEPCLETYMTAFDARKPFGMEYRLRNHEGKYRWVLDTGVPRFDSDGTFCGYIGSCVDITEQKEAQEANARIARLQRLAQMGELTASIAHELRQPLSAILLHAETLRLLLRASGVSSPHIEDILRDIEQDGQRASNVMVTIRNLVRDREGGERRFRQMDLNTLVRECQSLISSEAARRAVRIGSELASDLPLVKGAPSEILQVLINLAFNAMDAMKETHAANRCLTFRTQWRGDQVEVSVIDKGHGIRPEDMPRLFESFFTTRREGMGLGLPIAQSIVQVHGGRVWAENLPEGGAAVLFMLPADQDIVAERT